MPSLADKYRPNVLEDLVGQDTAVAQVRAVLARGWGSRAWWIVGPSGSGKSSIAGIIARWGADELGISELDAQWLTPKRIQEIERESRLHMLGQKSGVVYIVNEAHRILPQAIGQLLTTLEHLPEHCVWILTTQSQGQRALFANDQADDVPALISRCQLLELEAGGRAFAERAKAVAQAEGLDGLPLSVYESALAAGGGNLRRVLQRIESGAFTADARAQMAEQLRELERDYAMVAATKGSAAAARRAALEASKAALAATIANLNQPPLAP